MLRKFSVRNYKNFKDQITLDFTDTKKYNFNTGCIKDSLVNKALIMGTNGCGKTNLGYALFDIVYTLTNKMSNAAQTDPWLFLNGDSSEKYAEFIYEFQYWENIIEYRYRKTLPLEIVYESLKINDTVIFERDGLKRKNDYRNLSLVDAGTLIIDIDNGPLSVLRFVANNTIQKEDSPIKFVMDFASNMLYFRSLQDNSFIGLMQNGENLEQFIIRNGYVEDFQRFLREYAHLNVKLGKVRGPVNETLVQKFRTKSIPFSMISSSGTRSLMLFYYWLKHAETLSFLYVDEFDAFYHYELAEAVLKDIISRQSFQSILTSHNTDLVSNDLMRPDCYLILSNGKIKSMPELTDRELREGHSLRKLLIGGEFDE